ncbi:MAG: DUF951 domain-containing protein [Clostridia bacterium]|nr:DUF951 domain-containing protein [Clostridia bacterium]
MVEEIRLGDIIKTRKPHPCGCDEWKVIRTGADIKIRCSKCSRIVMLDRETYLKRKKALLVRGPEPDMP